MDSVGVAIAFALFAWWFSTGAILMLVRLPRGLHKGAMAAMGLLAALSLWGLGATRDVATPEGALAGFTYGLVIWGFLETAFLLGYVTGPRREPQSHDAAGLQRFRQAFDTLSFHEMSILAAGAVMMGLTYGSANEVGTWTFLVLWAMRISAKLNLFFGAPNVSAEFLPRHLDYLASYFARGRVSAFFPISVTLASLLFGVTIHAAVTAATPFEQVAMTLVATMLGLAIVEHWFLVLPLPDAALWRWALKGPATTPEALEAVALEPANDTAPASLAARPGGAPRPNAVP